MPAREYTLLGADGMPGRSNAPGTLGGHRRGRIYGRLDCPSALRALARGGYVEQRVFFADEATAVAAGFRPCAVCLPERYRHWRTDPAAPTESELDAILRLLGEPRTVRIGHSADPASTAIAAMMADTLSRAGHPVLDSVGWPIQAASWLRQARRFVADSPDAWVVTGRVDAWVRMGRRLRASTDWAPQNTVATASLADERLISAGGLGTFDGLRGAYADGTLWRVDRTVLADQGISR